MSTVGDQTRRPLAASRFNVARLRRLLATDTATPTGKRGAARPATPRPPATEGPAK